MSERPPDDRSPRSADELGEPDPFEVIDRRGRYILGAAEDYYGVWDTRGGDRYLERFPLTEEGFQAAERRFVELRRLSRRHGGLVPTALMIALGTGVGLWVLAGLAAVPAVFDPRAVSWLNPELIYVVDALGFRMGVGAILVLAGLLLLRRERVTRSAGPPHPDRLQLPPAGSSDPGAAARQSSLDSVLVAILVGGLAVWVLSAIAANLLFREPLPGPQLPFAVVESARPHFVALFVQELALRLWVAAFVLLLIRWARFRAVLASDPTCEPDRTT